MASWVSSYEPDLIIDKFIEAGNTFKSPGKAFIFPPAVIEKYGAILFSMLNLDSDIPELDKKNIINKVLTSYFTKGNIAKNKILADISRSESNYLSLPIKKYNLITSISINPGIRLRKILINDCVIVFNPNLNKAYTAGIEKIKHSTKKYIKATFPTNYAIVKISVSERSEVAAANKALDSLDMIRGIWNLIYNREVGYRYSSSLSADRKPINKFILGPLHTLHKSDGKLATEIFWYEPNYEKASLVHNFNEKNELDRLYKFQKYIRRSVSQSSYSEELVMILLRYTRTLDSNNWDSVFLKLWTILEQLTCMESRENYSTVIKRTSAMFKDYKYQRQILTHLKDYRNRSVHYESGSHYIETLIFQLKRYVEVLIWSHLVTFRQCKIKNMDEAIKFMKLLSERDELDNSMKMIKKAKRLIEKD